MSESPVVLSAVEAAQVREALVLAGRELPLPLDSPLRLVVVDALGLLAGGQAGEREALEAVAAAATDLAYTFDGAYPSHVADGSRDDLCAALERLQAARERSAVPPGDGADQ